MVPVPPSRGTKSFVHLLDKTDPIVYFVDMTYANVTQPPATSEARRKQYAALVREVYADMTRRNPDSIPSMRVAAAKGRAWKLLEKAGW